MNNMIIWTLLLSFMFMFMNHPLSLSIIIIMQTFLVAMITGSIMSNFMLSYIIMIIMISGMLVLFVYMSSVVPNKKFKMDLKYFSVLPILMVGSLAIPKLMESTLNNLNSNKEEIMLIKMFNYPNSLMVIFMVMYLFLSMISVSNIVNVSKGTMRMMTYE
uniref:NADH dehydrogenase subunit 6 n=1 Tax=Urochelellus acutihumeralis TaxID=3020186 RepID=UPI002410F3BF|nr:NADH dehydrogenase subunit 6 [Urochelellus acutihumeralis]WEM32431.1 NADH dehydrogenase subunit 6 [Urochelellus acutihumeralis]